MTEPYAYECTWNQRIFRLSILSTFIDYWQIISFSAMFFSSYFQTRSLRNEMSNLWVWKYLMWVISSVIGNSCSSTKQAKLHFKWGRETLKHSIAMLKCCCWWTSADRLINMSNFSLDQLHSLSMIKQLIMNWTSKWSAKNYLTQTHSVAKPPMFSQCSANSTA